MAGKLKVYELAKELSLESEKLLDIIQRLSIDIKSSTSLLGTEEVKMIREFILKQKTLAKAVSQSTQKTGQSAVTEKRVGSTVIRRRSTPKKGVEEPVSEEVAPEKLITAEEEVEFLPEKEVVSEVVEEAPVEVVSEEVVSEVEVASPVIEEKIEVIFEEPVKDVEEVSISLPEHENGKSGEPVQVASSPEKNVLAEAKAKELADREERRRRLIPSIIKKVATEQYLGEKIGPKPNAPVKKIERIITPSSRTTSSTVSSSGLDKNKLPKKVKEVELVTTEVAKDAKRRALERQDTVFKSTDYLKRELIHSTKKKKVVVNRPALKTLITTPAEHKRVVEMGATISVSEFAKGMGIKATQVIAKLMNLGVMAGINDPIDFDTASLVAPEFSHEIKQKVFKEEDFMPAVEQAPETLKPRPPVVTIMGHVDHGKTSLLDAIRKTNVAGGEAGGITQHIGAYTVTTPKGKVAFIDTPGHEAFTAMRARGAKVTDIVILVVSAVDGVMPQTLESVAHAKAAKVPLIVAVNKIDLPDANADRIKQTLAGHELSPEEWGGDTIYVSVSAKTGKGIDSLLESILLQAEMLELKSNPEAQARGTVVESSLDKNRGAVATVLVQQGTLHPGEIIVSGAFYGKVRAMTDSYGKRMLAAEPGTPVEVLGLPGVPTVGDFFYVVESEKIAQEVTAKKADIARQRHSELTRPKMTLEEIMASANETDKEARIILKSDVQGSVEALREALQKLPQEKVKLKVLHAATGGITETDVMLASASSAFILGFNIRPDLKAQKLAESEKVTIKTYSIIYDLIDDVKRFLEGFLDIKIKEKVIGRAEVRNIFSIPKIGSIAGSAVIDGKVTRNCFLRILRDSRVIYEGKISSLRRFKEDVKEVASGYECGIAVENFSDVKLGDQFEAFVKEEVKDTL